MKHLLPAIIWGVGIFLIISFPSSSIPKYRLLQIEYIDKAIHFIMFFGFSLLLCLGLYRQNSALTIKRYYAIYSLVISILYGAMTELAQSLWFLSRSGNILDFLANTAGAFTGVLIFNKFLKDIFVNNSNVID